MPIMPVSGDVVVYRIQSLQCKFDLPSRSPFLVLRSPKPPLSVDCALTLLPASR